MSVGGAVTFTNPSEVPHGVEWKSPPATPKCSAGVPVGTSETASAKSWSGTCTFPQPGAYTFWCTVHHQEMSGTITVSSTGTTTSTTINYPPPTTTGSTAAPGYPSSGPEQGPSGRSPLAGSASTAVKLSSSQHGSSVRGSVAISQAGAGGSLEVDLLAKSASLASGARATRARVGKLVRRGLSAGKASFSVPLSAKGRRALRHHGHLALRAVVEVSSPAAATLSASRSVVLHRR